MGLVRFILGVLGILLVIGVLSVFLPLIFLGGIATGNIAIAFGIPIFLIILGTLMVYYGFFYHETKSNVPNVNANLMHIAKWGILYTIAIVISNFVISRLMIADTLLITLISAIIVSIVAQIVRSHDSHFNGRWFIFYFLLYANIIWAFGEFIVPKIFFHTSFSLSLIIGFTLAGVSVIIQKLNLNRDSVKWFSIVLVIILLVFGI